MISAAGIGHLSRGTGISLRPGGRLQSYKLPAALAFQRSCLMLGASPHRTVFDLAHLFAVQPASIMAPAGGTEQIMPFFLPANVITGQILSDSTPFMKDNIRRP